MLKILHLLPSLEHGGAATQALMLARGLAGSCELRVCIFADEGRRAGPWREAGSVVHSLEWSRPIDPLPLWRLRRLLREFQPDRIHVWRMPALRILALVGRRFLPRCVVSQALPAERLQPRLGKLDRWLLRRVDKIIAGGQAEARCLKLLGLNRVVVVSPGVEVGPRLVEPADTGRRIVCLGNLQPYKGFREAMRAADYLSYTFADLELHVIGAGPFLPVLQRYREAVYHAGNIHLLGPSEDAGACLAGAGVCWVPSLTATGGQVALEAMALGRPVVASDLPHLREIIVDGVNGLLVPAGKQTALAGRTRQLFLDASLRRRLGEAAREHVREHFSAARFVERCRELYETAKLFPDPGAAAREKHGV